MVKDTPFLQLQQARERLAEANRRGELIAQRIEESAARKAELEEELRQVGAGPVSRSEVDAILAGTAEEPEERELVARAERAEGIRARIAHLDSRVAALTREAADSALASERALRSEIQAAELRCIRELEADYLAEYDAAMGDLIGRIILPLRALGESLTARGELTVIPELLGRIRIARVLSQDPSAHPDQRVGLWVGGGEVQAALGPSPLLSASETPAGEVVHRLIQDLGAPARRPSTFTN